MHPLSSFRHAIYDVGWGKGTGERLTGIQIDSERDRKRTRGRDRETEIQRERGR